MAGADVIEAAIGITLLLIVSYVVLGSITTAATTVNAAQKDMTLIQEQGLGTSITILILLASYVPATSSHQITFGLKNTGSEPIRNFNSTDVIISVQGEVPVRYSFAADKVGTGGDGSSKTWSYMTISPDTMQVGVLDPGETMSVQINNVVISGSPHTISLTVATPNGVSASAFYSGG
jgi:hypothetical protein